MVLSYDALLDGSDLEYAVPCRGKILRDPSHLPLQEADFCLEEFDMLVARVIVGFLAEARDQVAVKVCHLRAPNHPV